MGFLWLMCTETDEEEEFGEEDSQELGLNPCQL
jgi:hypothetical protein